MKQSGESLNKVGINLRITPFKKFNFIKFFSFHFERQIYRSLYSTFLVIIFTQN